MINYLLTSPEISCLLGVLSVILSILFYYKGLKYRIIAHTEETMCLSHENLLLNKIDFLFDNQKIDTLSITDVLIWNAGRKTINDNDIAPHNPLKISISASVKLLNYQLLTSNEPDNYFQLKYENNCIFLNFDYMSKGNGVVIRLLHTGTQDDISVSCKIKDGKKLLHVKPRRGLLYSFLEHKFIKKALSQKISSFIFLIFTIFLFPNAFIQSANYNTQNNPFNLPNNSLFMNLDSLVIFVLCFCSLVLAVPHIYNLFKCEPPRELLDASICER